MSAVKWFIGMIGSAVAALVLVIPLAVIVALVAFYPRMEQDT